MIYAKQSYRWVVLTLLWLLYLSFGLVVGSMAPLVTPIVEDLNISYSQIGLILGSWQLVYILASIWAGNIIDRWGEHKSLLLGALIIGLSASLRYFAQGFGTLLPMVALLGIGGPMMSVGGPKTISLWFDSKRRGIALGIFMTGTSIGILLGFSLTNSVVMPITDSSWRVTFLSYGILAFIVGLLWLFLYRDIKSAEISVRPGVVTVLKQIVKIRNVQFVLLMGLFSFATIHGLMNWLPKILETSGMSPVLAGFAASANILAGIPAVIVLPHVVPSRLRGRLLAIAAFIVALGLGGLIGLSGIYQFLCLIILGIAGSSILPVLLLILMDNSGIPVEYVGSAGGVFYCVAEIGGFLAPLLVGALFDISGSFLAGILLLVALNIVIIPFTFRLKFM